MSEPRYLLERSEERGIYEMHDRATGARIEVLRFSCELRADGLADIVVALPPGRIEVAREGEL